MSTSRVAIVVRTKDRAKFLARALADIAAQTFTDYTVVVVNDGGAPGPVDEVLASLSAEVGARVQVVHHEVSQGMEAASNAGLRATDSEFCAIHDDDDLWHPDFLARMVEALDASGAALAASRVTVRYEREMAGGFQTISEEPLWGELTGIFLQDLFMTNRVVPIGVLYRRSLHDEIGYFNEALPVVGDWEFHLRVAAKHEITLVDEPLAYWCQRPEATGAAANSVIDGHRKHVFYDSQVRAGIIRDDLASGGSMGLYLYVARQILELESRLNDRMDRHAAEQRELLLAETQRIRDELTARTSVGSRVRGVVSHWRDRRN